MDKNNLEEKNPVEFTQEKGTPKAEVPLESMNDLLDNTEGQIDAIAAQGISNTDEITRKLQSLHATEEEIKAILDKVSWVDKTIYKKAEEVKLDLQGQVIRFYEENFQNLHNSIIAEFKIRPIASGIKKLRKEIDLINHNEGYFLGEKSYLNTKDPVILSTAKSLKRHENISQKKLPKDIVSAVQDYNTFIQHRKYKDTFDFYSSSDKESADFNVLYAALLNRIEDCKDEDQATYLKTYFQKASKGYTSTQGYRIFSKIDRIAESEDVNLNTSYLFGSLSDRVEAFTELVAENKIPLQKESVDILKQTVLEMIDPAERYPQRARSLESFQKLVDLASFTDAEKDIIYRRMFINIVSIPYHPMSVVRENISFPYSEQEKRTILNLMGKDTSNDEYLKLVGSENFSTSPEIKEMVKENVSERLSSKIASYTSWGVYKSLLAFRVEEVENFAQKGILKDEDVEKLARQADEAFLPAVEAYIMNCVGKKQDFNISSLSLLMVDLPNLPEKYAEDIKNKLKNTAWAKSVEKILAICKHSRRQEYDKWHTDIQPLALNMVGQGILDNTQAEDANLFFEYIKKVGPVNLPNYFKLFAQIKRSGSATEMSRVLKNSIKDNFALDVDKICEKDPKNINLIINEIEKYRQSIVEGLINEDVSIINKIVGSEFGKEFLASVKGNSGHSQGGTLEEVLNIYSKKYKSNPDLFKVPAGYAETTVSVSEYSTDNQEGVDTDKQLSILLNNRDLLNFHQKVFQAIQMLDGYESIPLQERLSFYNKEITVEINDQLELTSKKIEQEKQVQPPNEKLMFGLTKKKNLLEKLLTDLGSINVQNKSIPEVMEIYNSVVPDDFKSKQELFLGLSLADMSKKFPIQIEKVTNQEIFMSKPSLDSVSVLSEFIRSHVSEHYLSKKHGEADAIDTEDKNTIKYLKKIWGTQDFEKGILAITGKKIDVLERGEISTKKKEITLIPSKGMQRIFSGDLGGACTSRKNLELAKGEYENIISYSLVMDKNTPQERFAGSFLVVESKTDTNENILVIRANNPSQNLAQMIDANELIEKIIGEVKKVAEARGIKKVGVAYNSGSASNRQYVVDYYQKSINKEGAIGLKNTKDTNFNGYPIYNKNGSHPTVLVS